MKSRNTLLLFLALYLLVVTLAMAAEYTVKAPEGWKKHTASSAPEHYMKNGSSLMLTIDSVPAEAKTPDTYVEYVKKLLQKSFKNVQFEPVIKRTINGADARELCYTAEMSGMKMKYDVVYVLKQTKAYTLTAGGMAEMFDSMKADYQAFFNSFKLN